MNVVCDNIRRVEPDPSGAVRLRAVRTGGGVLVEEMIAQQYVEYSFYGYPIRGPGNTWAIGEYEWQQNVDGAWVTLSRYKVSD